MPSSELGSIRAITFDLYGTLLDLNATFDGAFKGFLAERKPRLDASGFVRTWEWAYLHEGMVDTFLGGPRTSFEELRRRTLSQLLSSEGVEHDRADVDSLLAKATPTLFPDVNDALTALGERYTLAVLSNGDLAVLERLVATLGIPVHRTISVEQAGCYKPDQRVYAKAAELLAVQGAETLHVAAHAWDIRAAKVSGMKGAYIDRHNIPYAPFTDERPDMEAANLPQLTALI